MLGTASAKSSLIAAARLPACFCSSTAAAPATCGVAMDVPEMVLVAVVVPFHELVMSLPGA